MNEGPNQPVEATFLPKRQERASPVTLAMNRVMKQLIIPVIIWAFIASTVLGKHLWTTIYARLMTLLDITPSQGWMLPITLDVIVGALGIPAVVKYFSAIRQNETVSAFRHASSWLCIFGTLLCLATALKLGVFKREQLKAGLAEAFASEHKQVFDTGAMTVVSYSNDEVGVSLTPPESWYPMSINTIRRRQHSGAYEIAGGDDEKAGEYSAQRHGSYPLFAYLKHASSHIGYNPSLYASAVEKRLVASWGSRSLREYAESYAVNMQQAPHYVRSGPSLVRMGNTKGYRIQIEGRFPQGTIQQEVHLIDTEDYYVAIVASAMDETDLEIMYEAISTLRTEDEFANKSPERTR